MWIDDIIFNSFIHSIEIDAYQVFNTYEIECTVVNNLKSKLLSEKPCIISCFDNSHWYLMCFIQKIKKCFIINSLNNTSFMNHQKCLLEKISSVVGYSIISEVVDLPLQDNYVECGYRCIHIIQNIVETQPDDLEEFILSLSKSFDRKEFEFHFIPEFLKYCLTQDIFSDENVLIDHF